MNVLPLWVAMTTSKMEAHHKASDGNYGEISNREGRAYGLKTKCRYAPVCLPRTMTLSRTKLYIY